MIFLGEDYWKEEMPVYKLMEHLVDKGKYKNLLLHITDSPEKTTEIISEFRSGEIHT
jgi:hypothetical protein